MCNDREREEGVGERHREMQMETVRQDRCVSCVFRLAHDYFIIIFSGPGCGCDNRMRNVTPQTPGVEQPVSNLGPHLSRRVADPLVSHTAYPAGLVNLITDLVVDVGNSIPACSCSGAPRREGNNREAIECCVCSACRGGGPGAQRSSRQGSNRHGSPALNAHGSIL